MSIDPKRIVEDEGASPLAAMLRAARDDGLTPEEVDRIHAGLATTTFAAGAGATASGAKQTGMLASLHAKVGLALAIAVACAAGGAWFARRDVATAMAPLPGTSAPPSPPAPPSGPGPSAPSPAEPEMAYPSAAKAAPHPWRPSPAAPTPQAPIAEPASPPPATAANEGALLLEARRALVDDPGRALELVREHERQFPNSQLAPERARIAAEAAKRSPR